MRNLEAYAAAALLGTLAGMRSMAAIAVVGQLSRKGVLDSTTGPLALVTKPKFATVTGVLAATELVADKLPITPNRTAAGPLLGRALTGGLSGAVICSAKNKSPLVGALLGAAAGVCVAYAAYELRKRLSKNLNVPDTVIAIAEDVAVGSLGMALSSHLARA